MQRKISDEEKEKQLSERTCECECVLDDYFQVSAKKNCETKENGVKISQPSSINIDRCTFILSSVFNFQ